MPDYDLLFKCPRCGWWAAGSHHAETSLTDERLDGAIVEVKCFSEVNRLTIREHNGASLSKRVDGGTEAESMLVSLTKDVASFQG